VNVGWGKISFQDRVASRSNPKILAVGSIVPALARNARAGHPQC
jgi:hypothetical protein